MRIFNPFQQRRLSVDEEINKKPIVMAGPITKPKPRLLSTKEMLAHYGIPGDPDNSITITSPIMFQLAWDPGVFTNRLSCHKKISSRLLGVLDDLVKEYGLPRIKELGIDQFGGLGNYRPQRGLEKKYAAAIAAKNYGLAYTYLSRHSWKTALDLDPTRNTLKETRKTARFARPEYKPMIDIFYSWDFISYGIERNNDWMHFEIGVPL